MIILQCGWTAGERSLSNPSTLIVHTYTLLSKYYFELCGNIKYNGLSLLIFHENVFFRSNVKIAFEEHGCASIFFSATRRRSPARAAKFLPLEFRALPPITRYLTFKQITFRSSVHCGWSNVLYCDESVYLWYLSFFKFELRLTSDRPRACTFDAVFQSCLMSYARNGT